MGAKQPLGMTQEDFRLLEQDWELGLAEREAQKEIAPKVGQEHCGRMGSERLEDIRRLTLVRQPHIQCFKYVLGGHISPANPKTDDHPLPTRIWSLQFQGN